MGRCTSPAHSDLQAGIRASLPPLCGAGSPVPIIYTQRYQFLTICSREVCVNCCCCSSSLSLGHQFLQGSSCQSSLSDFLQERVKVVEQVLVLAPTGVSALRPAMPIACLCSVRLGLDVVCLALMPIQRSTRLIHAGW